jgi:hypothetical protein
MTESPLAGLAFTETRLINAKNYSRAKRHHKDVTTSVAAAGLRKLKNVQ